MEVSVLSKRSENSVSNNLNMKSGRFSSYLDPRQSNEDPFRVKNTKQVSVEDKNYTYDSENNFIGNSNYMDSKFLSNEAGQPNSIVDLERRKKWGLGLIQAN